MKTNIYSWLDKKTGEEFTGSIKNYCEHYNLTKPTAFKRVRDGRVERELIGVEGLHTFTDTGTNNSFHGTKQGARQYFGCSWATLYSKIEEGLIQVDPPEDKTMYYKDKISDPATKRLLNQYYLKKINELGCEVEDE